MTKKTTERITITFRPDVDTEAKLAELLMWYNDTDKLNRTTTMSDVIRHAISYLYEVMDEDVAEENLLMDKHKKEIRAAGA